MRIIICSFKVEQFLIARIVGDSSKALDALKMSVALYHILNLHYGHGDGLDKHCWLLEVIARTFKLGNHQKLEEKLEIFKGLTGKDI